MTKGAALVDFGCSALQLLFYVFALQSQALRRYAWNRCSQSDPLRLVANDWLFEVNPQLRMLAGLIHE